MMPKFAIQVHIVESKKNSGVSGGLRIPTKLVVTSEQSCRRASEELRQVIDRAVADWAAANSDKVKVAGGRAVEPQLFMHTPKAITRGCPADRVFLVTDVDPDGTYLAWKCTLRPDGLLHPAFSQPLSFDNLRSGMIEAGTNGSAPTAAFKKDSLYKRVQRYDLERLAACLDPA